MDEKRNLESRGGETRAESQDGGRSKSSTQTVYNKGKKRRRYVAVETEEETYLGNLELIATTGGASEDVEVRCRKTQVSSAF